MNRSTGSIAGCHVTHGAALKDRHKALGRATWRLDGFVSLDVDSTEGVVETIPLRIPRGNLHINANASNGRFGVKVLFPTEEFNPVFPSLIACR